MKISICVPCFNEEENIVLMYEKLKQITSKNKKYIFEFIFTDNKSTDNTRQLIKNLALKDKRVKGIFFSRNFGSESSGQAALNYAIGDAFIALSCDFQDPPEMILKFIKKWEEGYDVVMGSYFDNKEFFLMTIIRKIFYQVFKKIAEIKVPTNVTGFGLLDKKVVLALKTLPEKYRFTRGLTAWVGFKQTFIPYKRKKRERGKSSYSFFDYIKQAERGIFGFSYLILDLMVYGGLVITTLSFLFIVGYLYAVVVIGNPIKASIPTMLAIVFFGGIQLLAISIIGKYIQVIVEETKNRPMYIVEEIVNLTIK
ncbi:MAG: glycosyltransferase family 2 protein [Patescibacteria group bacterium]|jgi:glycosyltransferase involved in cell wall biosynthesis